MSISCWSNRRLLVSVKGPEGSTTVYVDQPFARVGSHLDSEVLLTGKTAPARAFYLHAAGRGVYAVRLAGRNPAEKKRGRWLRSKDELEVGLFAISVRVVAEGDDPPGPVVNTSFPVVAHTTRLQNGTMGVVVKRQLSHLTIVGRKFPSHLTIDDEELSGTHCALYWSGERLWAVDLLSSNGTTKDGVGSSVSCLQDGDSIKMGRTRLKLLQTVHKNST